MQKRRKVIRIKDVEKAIGEIQTISKYDPDLNGFRIYVPLNEVYWAITHAPITNAIEIPSTGIGDISDGYHTFNSLYRQRLILFAALVKAYRDKAWKSWKHHDGEIPFGGGWFIVGIETPEGQYTYHYEAKDWDLFDCQELPVAKEWDGHTEEDVTRLMSLDPKEMLEKELQKELTSLLTNFSQEEQIMYVMRDQNGIYSGM